MTLGRLQTLNFGIHTTGSTGSRLGPDWVQTGLRLGQDWVKTGSRLGRDWVKAGSRLGRLGSVSTLYLMH